MPAYKTKKFVDEHGNSDLITWHESLDDKGKAIFSVRMEYLCACNDPIDWSLPHCRPLRNGISEIRFKSRRVQQRPLGYFGPERKEFTFLFPAIEKGGQFIPKNAVERAEDRKRIVEENQERSNEWDILVNGKTE
jgi:hypothetical protein